MKTKNTNQLKRVVSTFLLISALGSSIFAQTGDDRSQTMGSGGRAPGQTVGSGGFVSGGLIGSGTRMTQAPSDSGGALESAWSWLESIF